MGSKEQQCLNTGKWDCHDCVGHLKADVLERAAECARLREELAEARAKADAEMERLKACEHIADGDDGWDSLRDLCPSTSAVSALRDRAEKAEASLAECLEALGAVVATDDKRLSHPVNGTWSSTATPGEWSKIAAAARNLLSRLRPSTPSAGGGSK